MKSKEYPWLNKDLISYAKEQEELFKRSINLWYSHLENILKEIENGNEFERNYPEEKGEGYVSRGDLSHAYREIIEAQNRFINRIIKRYERKNKSFTQFTEALEVNRIYEEDRNLVFSEELFTWIEKQLNGEALREKFLFLINNVQIHSNNNKVTFTNYLKWDDCGYGSERMYLSSSIETLFYILSHFENGSLEIDYAFYELNDHLNNNMEKSDFRKKWEIEDSNIVQSFKFYQNGKVEIEFSNIETAQKFYEQYIDIN